MQYTIKPGMVLQAPLLLPPGVKLVSVTVYYKNTTTEVMHVAVCKKSTTHLTSSDEFEVTLDDCPPGTMPSVIESC